MTPEPWDVVWAVPLPAHQEAEGELNRELHVDGDHRRHSALDGEHDGRAAIGGLSAPGAGERRGGEERGEQEQRGEGRESLEAAHRDPERIRSFLTPQRRSAVPQRPSPVRPAPGVGYDGAS
jgi:hypothetical protein